MGKIFNNIRSDIARERFKFIFYEVFIIFIFIFLISLIEWVILPLLVTKSSYIFSLLFYLIRSIVILSIIVLVLFVKSKIKKQNLESKEINLYKAQLKLYEISRKNFKYQLLYGLLLLFLILIPLDFIIIITFPNIINYKTISMIISIQNSYLSINNLSLFILISSIVQFSIVFSEETVFRGLITKRGSEKFNKMSAVTISALYYAFYEMFIIQISGDYYSMVIWFIRSLIIGLVFSLTLLRKKWLFPFIFAGTINNIMFNIIIWNSLKGFNIFFPILVIYCPLMLISLVFLITQLSRIKESLQIGRDLLRSYYRRDPLLKERSGDRIFRIIFDFLFGFLLFIIGVLISA